MAMAQTPPAPASERSNAVVQEHRGDLLAKLLEVPGIRDIYNAEPCKSSSDPGECIWNKLTENGDTAKQDELRAIIEQHQLARPSGGSTGENKGRYERNVLSNIQEHNVDPAVAAMQTHMSNLLRDAMYNGMKSQVENKQVRVVDHATFTTLFESRVSKGIVEAISSFCLDVTSLGTPVWIIPDDAAAREANRKRNTEALGTPAGLEAAKIHWNQCATNIKIACTLKAPDATPPDTQACPSVVATLAADAPPPATGEPVTRRAANFCSGTLITQQRACQVQEVLEQSRQQLLYLAAVKEGYRNLGMPLEGGGTSTQSGDMSNAVSHCTRNDHGRCVASEAVSVSVYNGAGAGEKTIEDVTTITSGGDIMKGYADAHKTDTKDLLERCAAAPDNEECQRFKMTQAESDTAKEQLAEMSLRGRAMKESLERIRKGIHGETGGLDETKAKEELTQLLKEEGRSQEQIDAIMNGSNDRLKAVISDINTNYESQRKGLIESLSKKITDATVTEVQNASAVIDNAKRELLSRPDEYKQVLHFSNIVTGLLDPPAGQQAHVGSMRRELENVAEGSGIAVKARLEEATRERMTAGTEDANASAFIRADTVTTLLEHDGLRKDPANNRAPADGTTGTTGPSAPEDPR
jgi:hypothetical protein